MVKWRIKVMFGLIKEDLCLCISDLNILKCCMVFFFFFPVSSGHYCVSVCVEVCEGL